MNSNLKTFRDCVRYEGSNEKHYTYTIITTDSNKQLSFLHDRMPVILENGSKQITTWLDPGRSEWSKELQSLLKPFPDDLLECYPVSKDVGKVGNNSPAFIVPVASTQNKHNIANFFSNAEKSAKGDTEKKQLKEERIDIKENGPVVQPEQGEERATVQQSSTEDNAPLPVPADKRSPKRKREPSDADEPAAKVLKSENQAFLATSPDKMSSKKTRSATNNGTLKGREVKTGGSQKITNFYK